ncbi:hypothetical protein TNCV_3891741 [Trichonephila clavipes]|nr:hypothetical protein TNCV_3891741 [Trichonephila clavipes]
MRYASERNEILFRIITGDEEWVHHFAAETKVTSMTWKRPGSSVRKTSLHISAEVGQALRYILHRTSRRRVSPKV